jgi:hypothetical protein
MSRTGLGFRDSPDKTDQFSPPSAARHCKRFDDILKDGLLPLPTEFRVRGRRRRACTAHESDHFNQSEFGGGQREAPYRCRLTDLPHKGDQHA